MTGLPDSDPTERTSSTFTPEVLDRTVIAIPLLKQLKEEREKERAARDGEPPYEPPVLAVILDVNLEYVHGRDRSRDRVRELVTLAIARSGKRKEPDQGV